MGAVNAMLRQFVQMRPQAYLNGKPVIVMLLLTICVWGQAEPRVPADSEGVWLFKLRKFPHVKFSRTILPPGGLAVLDATLSVDTKGNVHDVVVTPNSGPLYDSAARTVKAWQFAPGPATQVHGHLCLGRLDDGQGIGLPCHIYGPETAARLRLRWVSSDDLFIESNDFHPSLSVRAQHTLYMRGKDLLWLFAQILIAEDGTVIDAQSSDDPLQQDLAKQMKGKIRYRPVHLTGHPVEVVAHFATPVSR
jgi:hypothetical protein